MRSSTVQTIHTFLVQTFLQVHAKNSCELKLKYKFQIAIVKRVPQYCMSIDDNATVATEELNALQIGYSLKIL